DHAAVDGAPAGDHAVAIGAVGLHAEIGAAMAHEHVEFLEAALVQQQFDAFARGQFAAAVLGVDAPLAAAKPRGRVPVLQLAQDVVRRPVPLLSAVADLRDFTRAGKAGEGAMRQGCKASRRYVTQIAKQQSDAGGLDGARGWAMAQSWNRISSG